MIYGSTVVGINAVLPSLFPISLIYAYSRPNSDDSYCDMVSVSIIGGAISPHELFQLLLDELLELHDEEEELVQDVDVVVVVQVVSLDLALAFAPKAARAVPLTVALTVALASAILVTFSALS